jgi:hypothetical protein
MPALLEAMSPIAILMPMAYMIQICIIERAQRSHKSWTHSRHVRRMRQESHKTMPTMFSSKAKLTEPPCAILVSAHYWVQLRPLHNRQSRCLY